MRAQPGPKAGSVPYSFLTRVKTDLLASPRQPT
jgi:hypothetical protein